MDFFDNRDDNYIINKKYNELPSELNSKIDLNVFKDFTSLKCVLLIYEFNVNPSDINKMVTPANENQLVFYKIEIQS